ncbi:MAG: hypothetical protein KIS77_12425 [Saprospiraceae bacterium]|nr:hypothetical protein [Saprospiraceae bacterium]
MKSLVPVLVRIIAVFAVFWVLLFFIPYPLLVVGGIAAGFFLYKTSDDRPLAFGLLIGSVCFGIYAYLMSIYFPS